MQAAVLALLAITVVAVTAGKVASCISNFLMTPSEGHKVSLSIAEVLHNEEYSFQLFVVVSNTCSV